MAYYVPSLYQFFREVAENNNRPWFQQNKERYDELRKLWMADLDRMVTDMTSWEPDLASQSARSCAYRFYRDTRFSKNKEPYKLFFSAAISPFGRKTTYAAYYLEMGLPGYGEGLYGGLWMPDSATLRKLRHAIVDNIEEFEEIVNTPLMQRYFPGWCGESLKKVPKEWAADHPMSEVLKLKQYGKVNLCDEKFFSDPAWPEMAAERFSILKPFVDFLNYSIDEDTSIPTI